MTAVHNFRDVFLDRLLRASARCRVFATQLVLDTLPETCAFWVELNQSFDGELNTDEVVFPDDVENFVVPGLEALPEFALGLLPIICTR